MESYRGFSLGNTHMGSRGPNYPFLVAGDDSVDFTIRDTLGLFIGCSKFVGGILVCYESRAFSSRKKGIAIGHRDRSFVLKENQDDYRL